MPRDARHQRLLEDQDVERWFDNQGSVRTADSALRALGLFAERMGTTPKAYVRLNAKDQADKLQDYVSKYAGTNVKKAVVSWLKHNGKALKREVKVKIVTQRDQHVPSRADLAKVLAVANTRARAAIVVLAMSGQRIQVLGSGELTPPDGLRLGDITDLEITDDGKGFRWTKVPARFNIRKPLSKNGEPYFSFLGPEAIGYISTYLTLRIQKGERLTAQSLVIGVAKSIRSKDGKEVDVPFVNHASPLSSTKVSKAIKQPMTLAGITEAPYIFRSYFSTMSEMCRDLPQGYREFFAGHALNDIAKVYSLRKGLPEEKIEHMRAAFGKAMAFVETTEPDTSIRVADLERKLEALKAAQANPKQVTLAELRAQSEAAAQLAVAQTDAMSKGELKALAQADELAEAVHAQSNEITELRAQLDTALDMINSPQKNGNATQRIIPKAELAAALAAGARIVTNAGDGEFVVEG